MVLTKNILSIPKILKGILFAFLAILGIRFTYPFVDAILGLWTTTGMMYYTSHLIVWIIYLFVLWVMVWMKFFEKTTEGDE